MSTSKGSLAWVFFSLEGRIGRQCYWLANLVLAVVGIALDLTVRNTVGAYGLLLLVVIVWYPSICVVGKRWHDRGRPAWLWIIQVVPIVGWIWTLVECGLLAGDKGPNKYGPEVRTTPLG